jgi:hypothetical protein
VNALDFRQIEVAPLGGVIQSSLEVFSNNFKAIIILVLTINLPMNLVVELFPYNIEEGISGVSQYYRVQSALQFFFGTIVYLCIIHVSRGAHLGETISAGEAFRLSARNYGSALWAQVLAGLGILIGTVLLIVPGIILIILWVFVLPYIVVGNVSGFGSLGASFRFVRGRWWKFAGRLIAFAGIYLVAVFVLALPSFFLPESYWAEVIWITFADIMIAFAVVFITLLFMKSGGEQVGIA